MKIDIVQRVARKKDFWDLHELLEKYSPGKMIELHKTRYPYKHDEEVIRANFTNFSIADEDFDPICLKGKYWELIKYDFVQVLQAILILPTEKLSMKISVSPNAKAT